MVSTSGRPAWLTGRFPMWLPVALLLGAGVALVFVAGAMDDDILDAAALLYEIGVGALAATAIGGFLTLYLSQAERRRAAEEREREQKAEMLLQRQKEREQQHELQLDELTSELHTLGAAMDREKDRQQVLAVGHQLRQADLRLRQLTREVQNLRRTVDPGYRHPNQAAVDELFGQLGGDVDEVEPHQPGPDADEPTPG